MKDNWIIGIHAVTEFLHHSPAQASLLLLQAARQDQRLGAVRELAAAAGVPVEEVSKAEIDRRVRAQHQGVALLSQGSGASLGERDLERVLAEAGPEPLLLVLDGVTDPHNLGACLRTADAAGVTAVILPKDRSASVNPTVRKVASGAAETVTVVTVTNLARSLAALKQQGIWIVGTEGNAPKTLFQQDLRGPLALVMGSEGAGLRRLTREHCDFLVSIPMAGDISSLNVSVATGIALFEAVRQRREGSPPPP